MKDNPGSHISTLLPQAHVTLFSDDESTQYAFNFLSQDWRFARVKHDIRQGNVDTAIAFYTEYESPDVVIIQTDTIEDDFANKLEALALHCEEHTSAIVIGPDNDVNLYRQLIGMGVSDYLVRPLEAKAFADNIAATLVDKFGETGSHIIAVIGSKGGVGATTISEALAWGVSDYLEQKTFLMDAACGWSTLSVGMDFEPSTTLAEAVRAAVEKNHDSLTRMIHKASDNLSILSSGGDAMLEDTVSVSDFEELLNYFLVSFPVLIADLSAASPNLKRAVLARAHEVMLVTTPVLSSVRAARSLIQEIKDIRGGDDNEIDVIVNMNGFAPKQEVPKAQISEGLGKPVSAMLDYKPDLFVSAESEGTKINDNKEGKSVMAQLLPIVQGLVASKIELDFEEETEQGINKILKKLSSIKKKN